MPQTILKVEEENCFQHFEENGYIYIYIYTRQENNNLPDPH